MCLINDSLRGKEIIYPRCGALLIEKIFEFRVQAGSKKQDNKPRKARVPSVHHHWPRGLCIAIKTRCGVSKQE